MKISELFHSVQGEGHLTGKPMFFIRAQGCSVKCPIRDDCDQPESLGFKGGTDYAPDALAQRARDAVGPHGWVSITGGEPLESPLFVPLVQALKARGFMLEVETSGTLPPSSTSSQTLGMREVERTTMRPCSGWPCETRCVRRTAGWTSSSPMPVSASWGPRWT